MYFAPLGSQCDVHVYDCKSSPMYIAPLGSRCEGDVYDCLSSPCQNNGECMERTDGVPGYECRCSSQWGGRHCEYEAWSCRAEPCKNDARCITDIDRQSKYIWLQVYVGVQHSHFKLLTPAWISGYFV